MSTNLQKYKRDTKQVRIGLEAHQLLKLGAIKENMVMSRFLDKILSEYFKEKVDETYTKAKNGSRTE
ncbi:MAG: hypothetical protein Q7R98_01065 [Candidatus Jorgensenbacteria bacterium]|nr:hypothetical protein [Candidatus Jorgensenbacteria bacterium]